MAPAITTIEALPDPILELVLELAGGSSLGPSVTLVCKRWQRAFYAAPAIWRSFQLYPPPASLTAEQRQQWFSSKHRLLGRVAGLVSELEVSDTNDSSDADEGAQEDDDEEDEDEDAAPGGTRQLAGFDGQWQLSTFLDLLQPAQLRAFQLTCMAFPAAAAEQVLRFPQLERLHLAAMLPRGSALFTTIVRGLPNLRALRLCSTGVAGSLVDGILQLQQLTSLDIALFCAMPSLSQLTCLAQLRHLVLRQEVGPLRPPAPAEFPALQSFEFGEVGGLVEVGGAQLMACSHHGEVEGGALALTGVHSMTSLQQLLTALLPAGAACEAMFLRGCCLDVAALQGCSRLAALKRLGVARCAPGDDCSMEAVLQALLQQAPSLCQLAVVACLDSGIPTCLASRQGLTELLLPANQLTELPAGTYLSSLQVLDLNTNRFIRLPPALLDATALQTLDLECNDELALTAADVDGVLSRMPHLRELVLGQPKIGSSARVARALRRRMPQLQVL